MKKTNSKKQPEKKQPAKQKIGPKNSAWKKLVDAAFRTIKVSYMEITPVSKRIKKGSAQFSRLLASNVTPFDFSFQILLPETGDCEIDTPALVHALWARLFGTVKGRGMLRDALCAYIRKEGARTLYGSDVSFGKYASVSNYDDLLYRGNGGEGFFTYWEPPRKER